MDEITIKKALLQKKRLELAIDEFEVRILDLETEIDNIKNRMAKTREEIAIKEKEINELRK